MNPALGVSLKILSALAFTLMAASIKLASETFPTGQLIFFRSAFALVPLLAWLAVTDTVVNAVRTHNVKGHLLRSIIGATGMVLGFSALAYLPLTEAVAIGYAAPLIVVVLAALLLRETVRAYRWSAVGVGFVGVLVMLSPRLGSEALAEGASVGAIFGICAAFCTAGATIQVRRLTATERTGAIVFYFTAVTTLIGLSTIFFGWVMPTPGALAMLIGIGILGGIGQILLTESYRYADASLVAPFEYTTMIWATLLGWFLFGQWPQAAVIAGAVLVTASGIFVIYRERKLGLERRKEVEMSSQRPG
ncbi:DMT family transporter [Salinarimonas ramus]|uniref:DMT family transporter n=1 Tax=Salinarimonas ramus TaxID=690164 RepID=UPI001665083E|nr:DMT family transporter [Salinarimonas ramus]